MLQSAARARVWLVVVLVCPAAWLGACSNDTFTGDGGVDAGSDIITIGGGDGGPDATDAAVEVGPTRFCETSASALSAKFCADFDDPNDATAGFSSKVTSGGYTLELQQSQVVSPPTALQTDVASGGSGGAAILFAPLGLDASGPSTSAVLDLDVFIPSTEAVTSQPLFAFVFGEATGSSATQFGLEHEAVWRLSNVTGNHDVAVAGMVPTGWTHVTLTVTLSATAGSVALEVGDAAGITINNIETAGQGGVAPPPPFLIQLQLGASCTQGTGPTTFYYDNVVVHWQ